VDDLGEPREDLAPTRRAKRTTRPEPKPEQQPEEPGPEAAPDMGVGLDERGEIDRRFEP
jgi:hypothetical protein